MSDAAGTETEEGLSLSEGIATYLLWVAHIVGRIERVSRHGGCVSGSRPTAALCCCGFGPLELSVTFIFHERVRLAQALHRRHHLPPHFLS